MLQGRRKPSKFARPRSWLTGRHGHQIWRRRERIAFGQMNGPQSEHSNNNKAEDGDSPHQRHCRSWNDFRLRQCPVRIVLGLRNHERLSPLRVSGSRFWAEDLGRREPRDSRCGRSRRRSEWPAAGGARLKYERETGTLSLIQPYEPVRNRRARDDRNEPAPCGGTRIVCVRLNCDWAFMRAVRSFHHPRSAPSQSTTKPRFNKIRINSAHRTHPVRKNSRVSTDEPSNRIALGRVPP